MQPINLLYTELLPPIKPPDAAVHLANAGAVMDR